MENFAISPLVLRPTIVFNNAISKLAKEKGFTGSKFPLKNGDNTLNISINFYFEKYVVLTVSYVQAEVRATANLKEMTLINSYPDIHSMVLAIAGLIKSGDYKNITPLDSVGTLRCTSIEIMSENAKSFNDLDLVESLTGHFQPVQSIVSDVLERNEKHQLNKALTLIDKQGVIQQIPFSFAAKKEAKKKYYSCCNLFELFVLIKKVVEDDYLGANPLFIQSLLSLERTPEKVVSSFTAIRTIEQLVKDFHLTRAVAELESKANQKPQINSAGNNVLTLKSGLKQFYGSKEFYAVLFTALVTVIVTNIGSIIVFFKWIYSNLPF